MTQLADSSDTPASQTPIDPQGGSKAHTSPEPPPATGVNPFEYGRLGKHFFTAVRWYVESVRDAGKLWPGWETFERKLAFDYALILLLLSEVPRPENRRLLLDYWLASLGLKAKRGPIPKDRNRLMAVIHGRQMKRLWEDEMYTAWNMKKSLEEQGVDPRIAMAKSGSKQDLIDAVLAPKTTRESSLARLYANRSKTTKVRYGTARNALRLYRKLSRSKVGDKYRSMDPNEIFAD